MICKDCEQIIPDKIRFCAYCGEPQRTLVESLDAKITSLVVGLIRNGVHTTMSCEGHDDHDGGYGYPWIDVDSESGNKLLKLVRNFNIQVYSGETDTKVVWAIEPRGELRLFPEDKSLSLAILQKGAQEFGSFLESLLDHEPH